MFMELKSVVGNIKRRLHLKFELDPAVSFTKKKDFVRLLSPLLGTPQNLFFWSFLIGFRPFPAKKIIQISSKKMIKIPLLKN